MLSFAFILCSTLLLTSAFPQKTAKVTKAPTTPAPFVLYPFRFSWLSIFSLKNNHFSPKSISAEDQDSYDVVIKKIMSAVMQDVFGGKSMPESLVKRYVTENNWNFEIKNPDGNISN